MKVYTKKFTRESNTFLTEWMMSLEGAVSITSPLKKKICSFYKVKR